MNDHATAQPTSQSNTAGLVGFIISLVSLIGCGGLLSPISLIFSLVGMGKEPKGFAIAGLVLSILGSLWILFILFFGGLAIVLGAIGLGLLAAVAVVIAAVGQNAFTIVDGVHDHYKANGAVPLTIDELNLDAADLTDNWGNDFAYAPGSDGDAFLLISAGPDGVLANSDDLIGEIDFGGSDFNATLHHGYGDINRAEWGALPQATQLPELPDEAETDAPAQPDETP